MLANANSMFTAMSDLMTRKPVFDRILTARCCYRLRRITIIQSNASKETNDIMEKDTSCKQLGTIQERLSKGNTVTVMGDLKVS